MQIFQSTWGRVFPHKDQQQWLSIDQEWIFSAVSDLEKRIEGVLFIESFRLDKTLKMIKLG